MSKPDVLEKIPMNLVEVKRELRAIKKRDGELSFRGGKTEEYVNLFSPLTQKDATELRKQVEALQITRLKPLHVQKIVDLLPRSVNELKVLLQGYAITVSTENLKKIADLTAEYAGKKKKHEKDEDEEGEEKTEEQADGKKADEKKAAKPKKKAGAEEEEKPEKAEEAAKDPTQE